MTCLMNQLDQIKQRIVHRRKHGSPSLDVLDLDVLVWAVKKIERLQAIIDKLPQTADGVPVVPGSAVWCVVQWMPAGVVSVEQMEVVSISAHYGPVLADPKHRLSLLSTEIFYSTREAAEASA